MSPAQMKNGKVSRMKLLVPSKVFCAAAIKGATPLISKNINEPSSIAKDPLAGSSLSLAEIVLGTQIYRWFNFPIERPTLPHLRAWYDRLCERPGFKTHIAVPIT